VTEAEALLAQLRDIHEPLAPSGLPSSVWWITAAIAALTLLAAVMFLRHRYKRDHQPVSAIAHHCALALTEPADVGRLRLARLLRAGQTKHIHSTGDPWLAVLDKRFDTDWFTQGEGQQFGKLLYSSNTQPLTQSTCNQIQAFLEQAHSA